MRNEAHESRRYETGVYHTLPFSDATILRTNLFSRGRPLVADMAMIFANRDPLSTTSCRPRAYQ